MAKSARKQNRKTERLIDHAMDLCDAAEEIAGESRAASVAILNARLLCGSKEAFDKAVTTSTESLSWTDVRDLHEDAMAQDPNEDDEDDEDDDRRAERRCGR